MTLTSVEPANGNNDIEWGNFQKLVELIQRQNEDYFKTMIIEHPVRFTPRSPNVNL